LHVALPEVAFPVRDAESAYVTITIEPLKLDGQYRNAFFKTDMANTPDRLRA
jgi:hypothetical protein